MCLLRSKFDVEFGESFKEARYVMHVFGATTAESTDIINVQATPLQTLTHSTHDGLEPTRATTTSHGHDQPLIQTGLGTNGGQGYSLAVDGNIVVP